MAGLGSSAYTLVYKHSDVPVADLTWDKFVDGDTTSGINRVLQKQNPFSDALVTADRVVNWLAVGDLGPADGVRGHADTQRSDPEVRGEQQVRVTVPDHAAALVIDRSVGEVLCQQTGLRLATVAAIALEMRAEELGIEADPLRFEQAAQEILWLAKCRRGKRGRAQPILVAHEHEPETRVDQSLQGRDDARHQAQLRQRVDLLIGRLLDQRAVAVDEQDAGGAHDRATAASSRSFCPGVPTDMRRQRSSRG